MDGLIDGPMNGFIPTHPYPIFGRWGGSCLRAMSPFYLWQVGRLMLESHVSLRDDSEATTSEVDALEEWRLGAEIATSPIS